MENLGLYDDDGRDEMGEDGEEYSD